MKAVQALPDQYRAIFSINLQKDKKKALLLNGMALVIAAVMVVVMLSFVPISTLFDVEQGREALIIIRAAVLLVGYVVYMVLHELVHGAAMKLCGTKKVKYGFTGMYAFAGSDDYYDKQAYIMIALAPVVIWGVVLAVVNALVPVEWFWVVYAIQIGNVSGAAGDFYVTIKFSRLPKDILVKDCGVGMTAYSREQGNG